MRKPLPRGRTGRKDKHDRFTPNPTGNIEIQDDDALVMELLDEHRVVTSAQLLLVTAGDRNERAFRQRLKQLFDHGYIVRLESQRIGGAYALGIRGHQHLHPDFWAGPKARPPKDWGQNNRRIGLPAIRHEAQLTETLLAFRSAAERRGWGFDWSAGEVFWRRTGLPRHVPLPRQDRDPILLPVHPDAFVTLTAGGHRYHRFLEIDMGSEPIARVDWHRSSIAKKMQAYQRLDLTRLRGYDRAHDHFRALFVTTTEKRIESMREIARSIDPKRLGTHYFQFSTHNRCSLADPDALFDNPIWWTAKRGYDNARTFFLPTCPVCNQSVDIGNEAYRILNSNPPGLAFAAGATPLPDHLPDNDDEPQYTHYECPGLASQAKS